MGDMNFSLTTFNKSGKLLQIEYALKRVSQGKMALGIKATNGVVIACDKKVSSVLVDTEEYTKIQNVTPQCGFIYSGMGPDFRVLVEQARKESQKYYLTYREIQPIEQVVRETAQIAQEYTQSGGVRPFGVSCLVAGWDDVRTMPCSMLHATYYLPIYHIPLLPSCCLLLTYFTLIPAPATTTTITLGTWSPTVSSRPIRRVFWLEGLRYW